MELMDRTQELATRLRYTGRRQNIAGIVFTMALSSGNLFATSPVLVPAAGGTTAVGNAPTGVATGDFNGDGKPDIAIANSGSNNVTILLGNGSGGFSIAAGSPVAVGSKPMAIVVKDFDKDGRMDLAVVNQTSGNVSVLLGNGAGGFTPVTGSPFAAGSLPNFGASGDFNGDTIPDLAVSNSGSNNVTVLLGNGAGGFTPATGSPFATGPAPQALVTADFDTDGKTDIAVADQGDGKVTYLFGNGAGGFSPFVSAQATSFASANVANLYGMTLGDFYNHSLPDLVAISSYSNQLNILRSFGSGTDSYNGEFTAFGCLNVVAGDFDGDGNQDVALTCPNYNEIFLLQGNGNGHFNSATGPTFATGSHPYGMATADFNGDGRPDIVVTNTGDNSLSVLLTTGPVLAVPPPVGPVTPPAISSQTIFFTIPDHIGSDQPFALQATATSGLPVTFSLAGGPATINGNMLTITGLGTVTVQAFQAGNSLFAPATIVQSFNVALGAPSIKAVVNGASFRAGLVPANYYATIFGSNLASGSKLGDLTSAQSLDGTSVTVLDSTQQTLTATISFMSFGQINLVMPRGAAAGAATVTITNSTGKSASAVVTIGAVAPGLFSADGTGTGAPAADAVVLTRDGSQTVQSASSCTPFSCSSQAIPVTSGTQVYLILFGTGIRGRSGLAGVSMTLGGTPATVLYAGAQGSFPGLDQINVLVPASMAGAGLVDMVLTVDGVAANTLKINFR
jgi:uncharacterized protein (TIGR03437 family)